MPRFGEHVLPEAGLAVILCDASGRAAASIIGQADRVDLSAGAAAVIDFKSGALAADLSLRRSHLAQLAGYRFALQRIYPGATVRAAVFGTGTGGIAEAAAEELDTALESDFGGALALRPRAGPSLSCGKSRGAIVAARRIWFPVSLSLMKKLGQNHGSTEETSSRKARFEGRSEGSRSRESGSEACEEGQVIPGIPN